MLESVARFAFRRRWLMLALWVAALVGFISLGSSLGGGYSTDFSLPGTESQEAFDILEERFPQVAGETADIVLKAEQGVAEPEVRSAMESLFERIAQVERVERIESPYSQQGAQQQISPDGTIAFATVRFEAVEGEATPPEIADELKELVADANTDGHTVEAGGSVIQFSEFEEPGGAEMIGLFFAMVILLITFGSVLAMGLPIITALFGIGIALSLLFLFANFVNVPDFTPFLAAMIGIGVGIDYALFIVTRYRQQLTHGLDPEAATIVAIKTSGKAVLFAGSVVAISLLGILLMGFTFVEGVAIGGAVTVAVTMLASVTLLPAILGFVGRNIDRWKLRRFHREEGDGRASIWYRWSRLIQRRPAWPALIAFAVLVVMSLPVLDIKLGFGDAGTGSTERSSRRAYDLMTEGFGPGFNGPLLLASEIDGERDLEALNRVAGVLAESESIAAVTPPFVSESGDAAVVTAFPTTSPQDDQTTRLVKNLRAEVIPQAVAGLDTAVLVGGQTAFMVDFADANAERLPILIGVVIGLSFLLLVLVFRSILVPVKAAIMNLLSIGAAYGAIVAIFQWGWFKDLFGVEVTGPIEAWAPMMLFAVLFGLSMDYEIFLLSRIREEYLRTRDNATAVANGLANTARVITAAAAIMVALFLTFVFGFDDRAIKLFGLGLAVAIFVDATIVRMILVPATMELLGDANWWLPRWLDRILPKIEIEGEDEVVGHVLLHDIEEEVESVVSEKV